ncbi:MAG: S41 family peptidase [Anaerolineae bacterium]|nr:S41 family peptidase [Anaerolineae bacterium]
MEHNETTICVWKNIAKAIVQGVAIGAFAGIAFAAGFLYRDRTLTTPTAQTSFALIQEADELLANHFLYDLPEDSVRVHGAAQGLAASLNDPYTFFIEPRAAEIDSTNLAGKFGGIGAEIAQDEQGQLVITRVYRDSPAEQAGVQANDIIMAVDDMAVDEAAPNMDETLAAIRGEIGTPVVLTLRRRDTTIDIKIIRAEILIPSTFWQLTETAPQIGYIQIVRFTERSPEEVSQAIKELRAQGAKSYILDLRNNGGGLVDSAVEVAGVFLEGGVILYERNRLAEEKVFNASRGGVAIEEPLVILVNANTASASEILAGAFQDRERATLVGQQTFGKGSVQLILALSDGSSLHVTTAEWYTPDHHRIEEEGLTPDIMIQPVEGSDAELTAAVELLSANHPAVSDNP